MNLACRNRRCITHLRARIVRITGTDVPRVESCPVLRARSCETEPNGWPSTQPASKPQFCIYGNASVTRLLPEIREKQSDSSGWNVAKTGVRTLIQVELRIVGARSGLRRGKAGKAS